MSGRAASSHQHQHVAYSRAIAPALAVILFAAVLVFAIIVTLRYAHGWVGVVAS